MPDSTEFGREGPVYLKGTGFSVCEPLRGNVKESKGMLCVSDMACATQIALGTFEDDHDRNEVVFLNRDKKQFGKYVRKGDRSAQWVEKVKEYRIEYYEKGARNAYSVKLIDWPADLKETFTNSRNCFDFALSHCVRAKVFDQSTGELVAERYVDANGNGRLKWIPEGE